MGSVDIINIWFIPFVVLRAMLMTYDQVSENAYNIDFYVA